LAKNKIHLPVPYRTIVLPIAVLWLLTVTLLSLAYQTRFPQTVQVGGDDWLYQSGYLQGFTSVMSSDDARFRFTQDDARVNFPALGQTSSLELTTLVNAWSPEGAREVTLQLNNQPVRQVTNADWRTPRVVITNTQILASNATVGIQAETFVPHDYDANNPNRDALGAAVGWVTLTPRIESNASWWSLFTQPAWEWVFLVGLVATLAYIAGVTLGAARWGFVLAVASILFLTLVIALARIAVAAYIVPAIGIVLIALLLVYQKVGLISANRNWTRVLLILSVICLAWGTRFYTATHLPLSGDEQIYVPVSAQYADAMVQGDWNEILTSRTNTEHPLFVKLSFAAAMLFGKSVGIASELLSARFVSIAATTVLTALLAVVNPIAAAAFSMHSIQIHYSSQAYLEAIPALTISLAMIAFERAQKRGARWLYVSAVCLGLTAASKYIYAVAGFAILPFLIWRYKHTPYQIAIYAVLALVTFFVADPILWTNPVENFLDTLSFHRRVSTSELVNSYARPWWWHIVYLARLEWNPGIPYVSFDTLIFIGGILGLPVLWRHSRVYFLWFVVALVFLFLWSTKWEQYALTLITPLCLAFGMGLNDAVRAFVPRLLKLLGSRFATRSMHESSF
jgi:hypothetical protein